jgi:integrase
MTMKKTSGRSEVSGASLTISFEECTKAYLKEIRDRLSATGLRQWSASLRRYAVAELGEIAVRDVTSQQVCGILAPIWTTKPETATRLRGRLEKIFEFARFNEYRDGTNPAAWTPSLRAALPPVRRVTQHTPFLPAGQVPAFLRRLGDFDSPAASALRFAILTARRLDEVRSADWSRVDLSSRTWRVSTKYSYQPELVPLSSSAVAVLMSVGSKNGPVFVRSSGGALSAGDISSLMRLIHEADPGVWIDEKSRAPVHAMGFRISLCEWASEIAECREHVLPAVLGLRALAPGPIRPLSTDACRKLLEEWARFCLGEDAVEHLVPQVHVQ